MKEELVRQPSGTMTQQHFSQVPSAEIERSTFDRSHAMKTTYRTSGQIIPVMWDEVLPGDTMNLNATAFMRLATPLKPFMDNLKGDIHFFFVPNRLLWDKWEIFMGETRGPSDPDPEDLTVPIAACSLSGDNVEIIGDYLGLPIGQPGTVLVQDLPFRAYELIWWEWYRDQNIGSTEIDHPAYGWVDGINQRSALTPFFRNKRKDYFTSCLPWPQKGDPVLIPLGEAAPVFGIGKENQLYTDTDITVYEAAGTASTTYATGQVMDGELQPNERMVVEEDPDNPGFPNIYADLTQATATSINDLRTAFQIQRLLERDARGGTRYIELILSHFGVQSDDARLQRPEYLGEATGLINVNPVAATVATTDAPQGELAAVSTGVLKGGFTHSFTEHGIIMAIMSVQSDLTYQQGVSREWHRSSRYDYYWPALSHLGEQAVLGSEIYFDNTPENSDVFGYQERYAEYRYKPSRIAGQFRSQINPSLDVWHLAQDFESRPNLNGSFLVEKPPIARVVAVPTEPDWLVDIWFDYKCTRPMPVYSVPGMIDHF